VVVGFEEGANDGEDYDCEAGYDDAVRNGKSAHDMVRGNEGEGVYHVHALKADTTGFIVAEVAYRSSSRAVDVLFTCFERCFEWVLSGCDRLAVG